MSTRADLDPRFMVAGLEPGFTRLALKAKSVVIDLLGFSGMDVDPGLLE